MDITGGQARHPLTVNPHRTQAYRNRFILSRKHRLCYAAVDKAACSTLKWWLADVDGIAEEIQSYIAAHKDGSTHIKGIHDAYPAVAPDLVLRTFPQIRRVFESGAYFRYTVVRNPFTRIFSAWSDKFLKGRNPNIRQAIGNPDLFVRAPATVEEVRRYFEEFLTFLHDNPEKLLANRHWIPQYHLLRPDLLTYDCIAPLEQPDELKASLASLLKDDYTDPFARSRAKNISLLAYHPDLVSERAAGLVRLLYADDFSWFGYDREHLPSRPESLDPIAVSKALKKLMHERIDYAYRRLAQLEAEQRGFETDPAAAWRRFAATAGKRMRQEVIRMLDRVAWKRY